MLIVFPGQLGDALLFLGILRKIREAFPARIIVLATAKASRELLAPERVVDTIITVDAGAPWWARITRVLAGVSILKRSYAVVVNPAYTSTAVWHRIALAAKSDESLWFDGECPEVSDDELRRIKAAYTCLCTVEIGLHELDKGIRLLRDAGLDGALRRQDVRSVINLGTFEKEKAHQLVEPFAASEGWTRVAICPGARFKQKDWGEEKFVELIRELAAHRLVVFLLGDASDKARCEEMCRRKCPVDSAVPTIVSLAGKLTVRESIAVIAECDVCVGNDTFGLHAAIVVNTPSVVIMGGGDFGRWNPWGDPLRHRMVNVPMDCYGCGWKCIYPEHRCIQSITVEKVAREVTDLMSTLARKSADA
jgi:ADP-heptose:LPS heptosyltransferase